MSGSNIPDGSNDEDEAPMTLNDYIEEESKLVNDALAVLGSSDDKNCTYDQGYVKRQALYACVTCAPQGDQTANPAGICLACSYHCHEGHELIELYTKRLFRCDCGNSKFPGKKCNLEPNKESENEKNSYNQNFKGLYCTCHRPYPDPDDETPDEMIQCIVCEDWFHTRHLHTSLVEGALNTNFSEMICGSCTERLSFLKYYSGLSVVPVKNETADSSLNISVDQSIAEDNPVISNSAQKGEETKEDEKLKGQVQESCNDENNLAGQIPDQVSKDEGACLLTKMKPLEEISKGNATFWPSSFRSSLCSCPSCKTMYEELNIPWILDESDTVQAYEEEGRKKTENQGSTVTQDGLLDNELAKFNRVQQVELIHNYNEFKSELSQFLGKFVQEKKVVRKQDIDEFFQDMQAKKRRKIGNGAPPYHCH